MNHKFISMIQKQLTKYVKVSILIRYYKSYGVGIREM